ncbi:HAMP domain-containing sensor histidine kinase [Amycolatopsis sp. NPDC051128]|uniref:sensor histidine kinase n=1 Tax=Amycolatopsis sp. NPDC051128 TaxID=3155412 RepID=UPI00341E2D12
MTTLIAAAVAVAVLAVSLVSWLFTRDSLYKQFDGQLQAYAQLAAKAASPDEALKLLEDDSNFPQFDVPVGSGQLFVQFLDKTGRVESTSGSPLPVQIPVTARTALIAAGEVPGGPDNDAVDSDSVRVWVTARDTGGAVLIARDADGVERALGRLGFLEIALSVAGVAAAALVGRAVARAGLRPVDALTDAAEDVARTQEVNRAISVDGRGEIGRLAEAFNAMLSALARSRDEQRRLAEDASHELRTPLTSLRNNIELLIHADAAGKPLPPEDRSRLLTDLDAQSVELTTIIGELVELSTGDRSPEPVDRVDLADVVGAAVERALNRAQHASFEMALTSVVAMAAPGELERAVLNILDNAAKWSPRDGIVNVTLSVAAARAVLVVEDQGPGIAEADLPHVFERFYRADTARALPGSGLGLAIVEQVVTRHGGTVEAGNAEGGGARFVVNLPLS